MATRGGCIRTTWMARVSHACEVGKSQRSTGTLVKACFRRKTSPDASGQKPTDKECKGTTQESDPESLGLG